MTNRRQILSIGLGALVAPGAFAQQPNKVWRVGLLLPFAPVPTLASHPTYKHFYLSLQDLGFAEGKNITFEWRSADGKYERLPGLADELVKANVDLILASTPPSILAAKRATTSIPIVMVAVGDPVALGFVASYARPGGNITGVSNAIDDVSSKYLELLRVALPKLQRVGVLVNPDNPNAQKILGQIQNAARVMGLAVTPIHAKTPDQIIEGFAAARKIRAGAVIVQGDGFFFFQRGQIVDLATKNRLGTMWWTREPVELGGLMSYGQNATDDYRKAGIFAAKILRGTKPSELPVELPTILKFTFNRKTATALGVKITQELLLRADEIVE